MKKFDPLDQFLKDKIANTDSFEPVDFSEFEAFKKNAPDPLDRWIQSGLKNHESAVEESDWLAFQDKLKSVEEENNKVLGWFKKMLKHPPLEQVSFHEFQAFQRGYLFKKWATRLAVLLILSLGTYFIHEYSIDEKNSTPNNKWSANIDLKKDDLKSIHQIDKNKNIKTQTASNKIFRRKNSSNISINNIDRLDDVSIKNTHEKPTVKPNQLSKYQSLLNDFTENEISQANKPENIDLLKSKKGILQSYLVHELDKSFDRKKMKPESYFQFSLTNLGAQNVFENDVEDSKINHHYEDLKTNFSTFIQNVQIQYAYGWKYGLIFQGGLSYQQSNSKNHWEYHITEIPVIDSASNKIVGYVPLGPKGQVHVEKNTSFQTNSAIVSGSIGKSVTMMPGLTIQFSTSFGLKYQRKYWAMVPDLTTLDLKNQSFAPSWSMIYTPQISLNQRISKHWSVGGQINWNGNVKKQEENYLNFKEKTIFGMGINLRYYPFESKFNLKK
jgi:hypothetical protein